MKTLVIFYTSCIIILYSVLTYIGYRKEKQGDLRDGLLPEVTVVATPDRTPESVLLSRHFEKAESCLTKNERKEAARQVYDAIMVFTIRSLSAGVVDRKHFENTLANLSSIYVDLKLNKPVKKERIDGAFAGSELFLAGESISRSVSGYKGEDLPTALKDLNEAEESIAIAARFSKGWELEYERRLFNSCTRFLHSIIDEMEQERGRGHWDRAPVNGDNTFTI